MRRRRYTHHFNVAHVAAQLRRETGLDCITPGFMLRWRRSLEQRIYGQTPNKRPWRYFVWR